MDFHWGGDHATVVSLVSGASSVRAAGCMPCHGSSAVPNPVHSLNCRFLLSGPNAYGLRCHPAGLAVARARSAILVEGCAALSRSHPACTRNADIGIRLADSGGWRYADGLGARSSNPAMARPMEEYSSAFRYYGCWVSHLLVVGRRVDAAGGPSRGCRNRAEFHPQYGDHGGIFSYFLLAGNVGNVPAQGKRGGLWGYSVAVRHIDRRVAAGMPGHTGHPLSRQAKRLLGHRGNFQSPQNFHAAGGLDRRNPAGHHHAKNAGARAFVQILAAGPPPGDLP